MSGEQGNSEEKTRLQDLKDYDTALAAPGLRDAAELRAAEDKVAVEWNVGDVILGLYEVKEVHTGGGMGLVYKVLHKDWNTELAVKSPRKDYFKTEEQKKNFIKECETWVDLGLHPHVVSCYYVRNLGNIPRVFAEYVDGGNLKEWISNKRLYEGGHDNTLERILDIAIQMAWGIQYTHEKGVIHQDIKPANIMLTEDGTVKITDFGLARARAILEESSETDSEKSILMTSYGMTPAYCSPEQASKEKLTSKTDLWSWAVTVLEMFTSEVTWMTGQMADKALEDYLETHITNESLPRMSVTMAELLKHCFQRDPNSRPQDMSKIITELENSYQETVKRNYPRKGYDSFMIMSDDLNNKAISFLDLGNKDKAYSCWDESFKSDPKHLLSSFNNIYTKWLDGTIGASECINLFDRIGDAHKSNADYLMYQMLILFEQGHLSDLKCESGDSMRAYYRLITNSNNLPSIKQKCELKGHKGIVSHFDISTCGRYLLSGGENITKFEWEPDEDNTIRIWDIFDQKQIGICGRGTGYINCVSFGSDGKSIAYAEGNSVIVTQIHGHLINHFTHPNGYVRALAFSPDGQYLLSGNSDSIILWDTRFGNKVVEFVENCKYVNRMAFLPGGVFVITFHSEDRNIILRGLKWEYEAKIIKLWDVNNGKCLRIFNGSETLDWRIPNTSYHLLGLTNKDHVVLAIDKITNEVVWKCDLASCNNPQVADSHNIVSWDYRIEGIRIIERWSGRNITTLQINDDDSYHPLIITPDYRCIITGGYQSIRIWDIELPGPIDYSFHPYPILSRPESIKEKANRQNDICIQLDDAKLLIQECKYKQAFEKLANARLEKGFERNEEILKLSHHCALMIGAKPVLCKSIWLDSYFEECNKDASGSSNNNLAKPILEITNDDKYVCMTTKTNMLQLYDMTEKKLMWAKMFNSDKIGSIMFTPNSSKVIVGLNYFDYSKTNKPSSIVTYDIRTGNKIQEYSFANNQVRHMWIRHDKFTILGMLETESITEYALQSMNKYRCKKADIFRGLISGDSEYVVTYGNSDDSFVVYELTTGRLLGTYSGLPSYAKCVSISNNQNILIASSGKIDKGRVFNAAVICWDLKSGNVLRRLESVNGVVNSVSLSPDGRYALISEYYGAHPLRLWDMKEGGVLSNIVNRRDVEIVKFTANGRSALVVHSDGSVGLYNLDWEWSY